MKEHAVLWWKCVSWLDLFHAWLAAVLKSCGIVYNAESATMKSAVFSRVQCEIKILFSSTKVGLRGVLPLGAATGTRNFAAVHSTLLWSLPSAHWQRAVAEAAIQNGCSWSSASCWRLCWVTFRMISALLYVVVCAGCVHNFFFFLSFCFIVICISRL